MTAEKIAAFARGAVEGCHLQADGQTSRYHRYRFVETATGRVYGTLTFVANRTMEDDAWLHIDRASVQYDRRKGTGFTVWFTGKEIEAMIAAFADIPGMPVPETGRVAGRRG